MGDRKAGMGAPVSPSLVSRVAAGLRYALTGAQPNGWFSPMEPIAPAVPNEQREQQGVAGRQFDFSVGYNVNTRPRQGEAISFETLRALSENFDLLRLLIETRKDQIASLPWCIRPKKKGADHTPRCEELEAFFHSPDREHEWDEWLRMVLEDLFVLDAPAVYRRKTKGGQLYALEAIDGATIKRVIDITGRTPMEGPAYQQVLKGVPAVDYTRDELIYKPRNVRTHKIYGYGPVEQLINTVNIALRRQQFTLDYFTSGTVPDALAGVPETWTPEQINQFQNYWDLLLQDDQAARRKLKFVPGEIARNFKEVKQPPLKDMFDEWLARLACYCMSIDPTPFVAQVNRAVAETTREQSLSEGQAPLRRWVKALIDKVIREDFGATDVEFAWLDEEVIDAKTKADINCAYVTAKVMHPDEVRADLNLPPLTPEQKADMTPPPPVMPGADGEPPKPGQKPGQKPGEQPGAAGDKPAEEPKAAKAAQHHFHINVPAPEVIVDVGATTIHAHIDGRTESQRIEREAEPRVET